MVKVKPWYKSRIIWTQIVQIAAAALAGIELAIEARVVPDGYEGAIFIALAVLTTILRFDTSEPVR